MIEKRVQMTCSKDEFSVIKLASAMGSFDSISDYVRSLITADIIVKKKANANPWIYGMSKMDWDRLTDGEKEKFMNQISPVEPASIDHFLEMKKNGPSPMEVGLD